MKKAFKDADMILPVKMWLDEAEPGALSQIINLSNLPFAFHHIAIMADCHQGYGMCIGGVLATERVVIPNAVGVDIGCGLNAIETPWKVEDIAIDILKKIMQGIREVIPLGFSHHKIKQDKTLMPIRVSKEFEYMNEDLLCDKYKIVWQEYESALTQIGTLGGGNHFIEIQKDANNTIWIMLHSGSRNIGFKVANYYNNLAKDLNGRWFAYVPKEWDLAFLPFDSEEGKNYLKEMNYCVDFALANRKLMIERIAEVFNNIMRYKKIDLSKMINIAHNYCIPNTEKIPTTKGPKNIENINIGEKVYTPTINGFKTTTIINKTFSGKKKIYTIETKSKTIRVSGDHLLLTIEVKMEKHPTRKWDYKRKGRYIWKKAKNIKLRDILVCANNYYDHSITIGNSMARFIGAFIGDGWIRREGYGFGLAIGDQKNPITSRYETLVKELFPKVKWKNNAKGAFGLTGTDQETHTKIVNLELNKISKERYLPNFCFSLTINEKIELLSGYFDSDGWVSKDGRGMIACASFKLIKDLHELADSLGFFVSNIRKSDRFSNFGCNILFKFSISSINMRQLDLWSLNKSKRIKNTIINYYKLQLEKIGYINILPNCYGQYVNKVYVSKKYEKVWDIEIANNMQAFICEGIVVHNCRLENHFGKNVMIHRKGATSAKKDEIGIIPGSQGSKSYIVRGLGNPESFLSCSHGAGRKMGRKEACRQLNLQEEIKRLDDQGIIHGIRNQNDLDEATSAYKNIDEVMQNQNDLVEIITELHPIAVLKG